MLNLISLKKLFLLALALHAIYIQAQQIESWITTPDRNTLFQQQSER